MEKKLNSSFVTCKIVLFAILILHRFQYIVKNMTKFECLETNQYCLHENVKGRLNSGNACCHSVQCRLSFCLLSKSLEINLHKTIILRIVPWM